MRKAISVRGRREHLEISLISSGSPSALPLISLWYHSLTTGVVRALIGT